MSSLAGSVGSVLAELEVTLAFTPLGAAVTSLRGDAGWGTNDGAEAEKEICCFNFAVKSARGSDNGFEAVAVRDAATPGVVVEASGRVCGWSVV